MLLENDLGRLGRNPFSDIYSPAGMLHEVLGYLPGRIGKEAPDTINLVLQRAPFHGGAETAAAEFGLKVLGVKRLSLKAPFEVIRELEMVLGSWYAAHQGNIPEFILEKIKERKTGSKKAFDYWSGALSYATAAVISTAIVYLAVDANITNRLYGIGNATLKGIHVLPK